MSRQTLKSLAADLEALRVRCAKLEAENESLRANAAAANKRGVRTVTWQPAPPSAEQLARREAMRAAREEAMRTGHCVRVA